MLKKSLLLISSIYVVFFVIAYIVSLSCASGWCKIHDDDLLGIVLLIFSPLIPFFIFSLITYKMREEAFRAWWNFACWFVPIIIVVTLLQNIGPFSRGRDFIGFNMWLLGMLYIIFVIVSIIRILLVYKKKKI